MKVRQLAAAAAVDPRPGAPIETARRSSGVRVRLRLASLPFVVGLAPASVAGRAAGGGAAHGRDPARRRARARGSGVSARRPRRHAGLAAGTAGWHRRGARGRPGARDARSVAAREAGRAVGAQWVLFGSFTRFGEGASLDVSCVPVAAPGDPGPRSIFVQSGQIADLIRSSRASRSASPRTCSGATGARQAPRATASRGASWTSCAGASTRSSGAFSAAAPPPSPVRLSPDSHVGSAATPRGRRGEIAAASSSRMRGDRFASSRSAGRSASAPCMRAQRRSRARRARRTRAP